MKVSLEEIDAAKSEKGGWNKKTLARWDVPWPPPEGWKESLINGTPLAKQKFSSKAMRARHSTGARGKLFHSVIMAVIENGHADILAGIPGLDKYYGNKLPTVADVIGGRPKNAVIEGGISFDDKVYKFACIRSNVRKA